MKAKQVKILGSTISYFDNEIESDQTLVFIHGNSSSKNSFSKIFSKLTAKRVVALDLFGHGGSEVAEYKELYSIGGYTQLLNEFLEILNLDKVILFGHSLGGHIAIQSIPLLDEKVQGLFTWGTPPLTSAADFGTAFRPNPVLAALFAKEVSTEDSEAFIKAGLLPNFEQDMSSLTHDFDITDPNARAELGASMNQGKIKNEIEILENFNKPMLLVQGNFDQFINSDYMIDLTNKYSFNIRFEDFSHYPQFDDSENLTSIINRFLEESLNEFSSKNNIKDISDKDSFI